MRHDGLLWGQRDSPDLASIHLNTRGFNDAGIEGSASAGPLTDDGPVFRLCKCGSESVENGLLIKI